MAEDTIAELFARAPNYTREELDRVIDSMRQARAQFKLTGKGTAEKRPVDLKELGLL